MAKNPINRDTVKKVIDALTPMNPETAEKFVQELLRIADERRRDVERVVGDVAKVGVRTAEGVASSLQQEWARQLSRMAERVDDLEKQVESLAHALESTRAGLVSLAARSSGGTADTVEEAEAVGKKASKSARKAAKKVEKKSSKKSVAGKAAEGATGAGKSADGAVNESDRPEDSGSPAIAGI